MVLNRYSLLSQFYEYFKQNKLNNLLGYIALLVGIECLVLSFTYRWIFSGILLFYSVYLMVELNKARYDQVSFL